MAQRSVRAKTLILHRGVDRTQFGGKIDKTKHVQKLSTCQDRQAQRTEHYTQRTWNDESLFLVTLWFVCTYA